MPQLGISRPLFSFQTKFQPEYGRWEDVLDFLAHKCMSAVYSRGSNDSSILFPSVFFLKKIFFCGGRHCSSSPMSGLQNTLFCLSDGRHVCMSPGDDAWLCSWLSCPEHSRCASRSARRRLEMYNQHRATIHNTYTYIITNLIALYIEICHASSRKEVVRQRRYRRQKPCA